MNKIAMPTGRTPKPLGVKIIKVEILDENGDSLQPPQYKFWVIQPSNPPIVLSPDLDTYESAREWVRTNGYAIIEGNVP